jgi:hypothetical protein
MKNLCMLLFVMIGTAVMLTVPAAAQTNQNVDFTTSFPFYAGNAKMPAGTYTVSLGMQNDGLLTIQSKNESHVAFIEVDPTSSESPHATTDVTFNKYGSTDYLNKIWVQGASSGFQVNPTRMEKKAASTAAAAPHTVQGKGH